MPSAIAASASIIEGRGFGRLAALDSLADAHTAPRGPMSRRSPDQGRLGRGRRSEHGTDRIISRPESDEGALRRTWKPFIHTHHYEVHTSFYESWLGNHPRRSGEAYLNEYWEAKFIENNPIPSDATDLQDLTHWFAPLFEVERRAAAE